MSQLSTNATSCLPQSACKKADYPRVTENLDCEFHPLRSWKNLTMSSRRSRRLHRHVVGISAKSAMPPITSEPLRRREASRCVIIAHAPRHAGRHVALRLWLLAIELSTGCAAELPLHSISTLASASCYGARKKHATRAKSGTLLVHISHRICGHHSWRATWARGRACSATLGDMVRTVTSASVSNRKSARSAARGSVWSALNMELT